MHFETFVKLEKDQFPGHHIEYNLIGICINPLMNADKYYQAKLQLAISFKIELSLALL